MVQKPRHGRETLAVRAPGELSQDAELSISPKPGGSTNDTVNAYGSRDAVAARARAVRVQVLVHLVHELVVGVLEALEVVVGRVPRPSPCPRVSLGEYVLRGCAGPSNGGYGGLVEVQHQSLVHVVILIVDIENLM